MPEIENPNPDCPVKRFLGSFWDIRGREGGSLMAWNAPATQGRAFLACSGLQFGTADLDLQRIVEAVKWQGCIFLYTCMFLTSTNTGIEMAIITYISR